MIGRACGNPVAMKRFAVPIAVQEIDDDEEDDASRD